MHVDFNSDDFKVALVSSVVLYGFDGEHLKLLIATKTNEPFVGASVLPTVVIKTNEDPLLRARDLMRQITGFDDWPIERLNAFADPYRNPNGRVVNLAYYGTLRLSEDLEQNLGESEYRWVEADHIPALAYDHNEIVNYSKERLKRRVKRRPIGFSLLPREFTLNQIQSLYESALSRNLDKRNFRRKLLKSELLIDTGKTMRSSARAKRPSALFRFIEKKYRNLSLSGYDFVYQ
jgi:8-oxo-dGTP diphosphatase